MIAADYQAFVESTIGLLRKRIRQTGIRSCTISEVEKALVSSSSSSFMSIIRSKGFRKELEIILLNNPKLTYTPETLTLTMKQRFSSVDAFVHHLYVTREGVLEDQDLYDDIPKDKIDLLKRHNLLREIIIREKKSKPPITVLFTKQHENDEVDKVCIETKTPDLLRREWAKIDASIVEEKRKHKKSVFFFLDKFQASSTTARGKYRRGREENIALWRNFSHLGEKILKGLRRIEAKNNRSKSINK